MVARSCSVSEREICETELCLYMVRTVIAQPGSAYIELERNGKNILRDGESRCRCAVVSISHF